MKTSSPGVSDLFLARWMYSSIVQLENNDWKRESVLIWGCQQNLDRFGLDRIGSDCGSDWIGLVFSLLVQKNYFEKSCDIGDLE